MALMTKEEVRAFTRETSLTYDTLIDTYIPLIEEDICTYLDNWFQDNVIYVEASSGLAFSRGNSATATSQADYITDDDDRFSTAGFAVGMDIAIAGGSNNGIYTIAGQTTAVLTMTDTAVFYDQDQDASYNSVGRIRISRMKWPSALKPVAAKMIWYQVDQNKPGGAIQERVDDYSITFASGREYPQQIINQLDLRWKQAKTK